MQFSKIALASAFAVAANAASSSVDPVESALLAYATQSPENLEDVLDLALLAGFANPDLATASLSPAAESSALEAAFDAIATDVVLLAALSDWDDDDDAAFESDLSILLASAPTSIASKASGLITSALGPPKTTAPPKSSGAAAPASGSGSAAASSKPASSGAPAAASTSKPASSSAGAASTSKPANATSASVKNDAPAQTNLAVAAVAGAAMGFAGLLAAL